MFKLINDIETDWKNVFIEWYKNGMFKKVEKNLEEHTNYFPYGKFIFRAFNFVNVKDIKVVILGQDPYHTPSTADGLAFSTYNKKVTPSLKNIFNEIANSKCGTRTNPDLSDLAGQGVLLMNTILTVGAGKPLSHKSFGWQEITNAAIKYISDNNDGAVFLLWGNEAKKRKKLIDTNKHTIFESPHPSPLSAHHGFIGNKHFLLANQTLIKKYNKKKIEWQGC